LKKLFAREITEGWKIHMTKPEATFRNAAIGGFHRGDVLAYITEMTQSHQAEEAKLREQIEALERENQQYREQLSGNAELEELQKKCAALEEENRQLLARQTESQQENAQLRQELETCQPDLQAYTAIRGQVADIEMDARTHSYAIRAKAEAEAESVCQRANAVLERTRRSFDSAKVDVESTVAHLLGELRRTEEVLANLEGAMDANETELNEIKVEWEAEAHE
jgi:chromosome segregation ATPase